MRTASAIFQAIRVAAAVTKVEIVHLADEPAGGGYLARATGSGSACQSARTGRAGCGSGSAGRYLRFRMVLVLLVVRLHFAARSRVAMSIRPICFNASITLGFFMASSSGSPRGTICQESPKWSFSQPQRSASGTALSAAQ
jgi:hypothetical protein